MLHSDKLTWKDVAHALKELNLHQLSERILQTHDKNKANGLLDAYYACNNHINYGWSM